MTCFASHGNFFSQILNAATSEESWLVVIPRILSPKLNRSSAHLISSSDIQSPLNSLSGTARTTTGMFFLIPTIIKTKMPQKKVSIIVGTDVFSAITLSI